MGMLDPVHEAMAAIRELHSKPIATMIKAGERAWPKFKGRMIAADSDMAGRMLGIPVHVLEPNAWPPNLVAVLDQEGNAITAWIIND